MKVLRLVGGLNPLYGGPTVSSVNGAIAARRAGVETTIAFPAPSHADEAEIPALARLRDEGVKAILQPRTRGLGAAGTAWGVSAALVRWVRANARRFDIIQCHGAWKLMSIATLLMYRENGPRTVLVPHESLTDYDLASTSRPGMSWIKRRLRPRMLTGFDRIVFASAIEARDSVLAELSGRVAQTVVYHPIFDDRHTSPPVPSRVDGGSGGLVVGFLGRLHRKKNVHLMIEALTAVPESVRVRVAGSGEEMGRLRAIADLKGVGKRVEWLGFIGEAAKRDFFASIDVLAMPSDYECFGMAIAEAMCAGVPVLVSEETGVTEVVRRYGCGLIVAREGAAIAAALERFRADPAARRTMAARAAEAAQAEFSFAAHGKAMASYYEEVMAMPR